MATMNHLNISEEINTTGEPTDQLAPVENKDELDSDLDEDGFDDDEAELDDDTDLDEDEFGDDEAELDADTELDDVEPDGDSGLEDDEEDLDDDEVKRLFPGEDSYTKDGEDTDDEPYEGIRHSDKEEEGMVDDNMSGMPVVPSPS